MNKESVIKEHYKSDYFNNYQKQMGAFGGLVNKFMFDDHIGRNDTVLDFGCGGGFLLKNLCCKTKIGIEVNPVARDYCYEKNKITCLSSLDYIEDGSVDVVVSCHCLEHTTTPFGVIATLYDKLKEGGKIIIVIPLESFRLSWNLDDVNKHLYSFSPMNLGNLLHGAGFKNISTKPVFNRWPPFYEKVYSTMGLRWFQRISWIYGRFFNKLSVQVKGYGEKLS